MKPYWYGDRKRGYVRLVSCRECEKPNLVSCTNKGPVRRVCDGCQKDPPGAHSRVCLQCGRTLVGDRRSQMCSELCRKTYRKEYYQRPERTARRRGANLIRDRAAKGIVGLRTCQVCKKTVDPLELSRWGYEERGLDVHISAGSYPEAETVDGPSCHEIFIKSLDKNSEGS